MFLSRIGEIG